MRSIAQAQSFARKHNRSRKAWRIYFSLVFASTLLVPVISAFFGESYLKALLAINLLSICLYPTARYFARDESGVPVFAILCLSYAVQFALPVFTKIPTIHLIYGETYMADSDIIAVLFLSFIGVCALQAGYYALTNPHTAKAIPSVYLHLDVKKATIFCLLIGILLPLLIAIRGQISEEINQQFGAFFNVLQNQQFVVIGVLGWLVYSGLGGKGHKILLYCVIAISVWRGLSTAFLEQAVLPLVVLFVTKWLYQKSLPGLPVAAIVLIILFLSPVKSSFREAVWSESANTGGIIETLNAPVLWVEQASEYWADTLSGSRELSEATASATSRSDLLHQFALIYSMTPEAVPYQYGGTYSYFLVSMIPRALWPEKPTAGGANNFFAVAYGITTEEGTQRSTFGVSLLGEGYLNFGWMGVVLIMLLQGLILSLLQSAFGGSRSGAGGQAVFLAFFIFFLNGVGTSAEIFFGNILQNLLCSCALLLWAREKRSARKPAHFRMVPSNLT